MIAHSPYTSAVDVWTLGVLMFILLSGYHPFDVYGDMPEPKLLKKILSCNYDFDDEVWDYVSTEAKELITKLLVLDADKRMTLDAYLQSSWIKETITHENELPNVVNRLAKFSASKQLTGKRGMSTANIYRELTFSVKSEWAVKESFIFQEWNHVSVKTYELVRGCIYTHIRTRTLPHTHILY